MEFDYEVSAEDYANALILYYRLSRRRLGTSTGGLFIFGGFLLTVGLIEREKGLSPLLLVVLGAFTIWLRLLGALPPSFSPQKFPQKFRGLGTQGKKSPAELSEKGI